jgi:flagellin-like hook-associated protein FlgL
VAGELYGSSSGYDSGDSGASHGYERSSYPVDENGQESGAEDAEPMTRAEYADQVREELAARVGDTGPDYPWGDTHPDEINYANGNTPEIAWRDQGNPDSPNGLGYLDRADLGWQGADTGDDGDMWGDTYPDDAADHAATWDELMAELDHASAETVRRPPSGEQRPGSADSQARYPNGVTDADRDPSYYDDIQAALAADTRPTRQQAARDDGTSRDGQGDNAKPHVDRIDGHDADIYAILHENDHLPGPRTRQQAAREDRQAGADPKQAPGLTETSTVADGAAYRSWEDGLPTRQESREKTWGPDAEFWDENEQAWRKLDTARTPDTDAAADTTGIGDRQHGEHPYPAAEHHQSGEQADHDDGETSSVERVIGTDDALRQRVADLETANAELIAENTQLGRGMAELESENADLGKSVTVLEARLGRLEQQGQDNAATSIRDRKQGAPDSADQKVKQERGRKAPSSEALLFGAAAVGGVVTTVADYVQYVPASIASIAASGLAAGAAAVAWWRKRREG